MSMCKNERSPNVKSPNEKSPCEKNPNFNKPQNFCKPQKPNLTEPNHYPELWTQLPTTAASSEDQART